MRVLAADRVGALILLLATLAGLGLGLAGPDTSPVAPGAPPVQVLDALTGFFLGGSGRGGGR